MTLYTHNPALLSHADGFALTNGATTDAAAGTVLTCALSTGGTVTHRTSPVRSWECVGNAGVGRLDIPVTAAAALGVEILFDIIALPTGADNRLIEIRHATNYAMKVEQDTAGRIFVRNAANAIVYTSTALGTGQVRIFAACEKGTGTTDGSIRLHIYSTNPTTSTTPDQSYSVDNGNAGTADLVAARAGRVSSTAGSTADVKIVNWRAQDSLVPIGPMGTSVVVDAVVATVVPIDSPAPVISVAGTASGGGPATLTVAAPAPQLSTPMVVAAIRAPITNVTAPAPVVSAIMSPPVYAPAATLTVGAVAPLVRVAMRVVAVAADVTLTAPDVTATGTVSGIVSPPATVSGLGAHAPHILAGAVVGARFTPPGVTRRIRAGNALFQRMSLTSGVTLLKEGSTYRQVEGPTAEEVTAASITYLGGHEYPVSSTEADALTAAGYGQWLQNTVEVSVYV